MTAPPLPPVLTPGAPAPDAALTGTDGGPVSLSDVWTQGPTALVFLRHLGCVFCREQVAVLRRNYADAQATGVQIACIAQGDPQTGKAFTIMLDMPFPLLLCGDDVNVYQAYGLARGTMGQLFGVKSVVRGFQAMLHGRTQGKLTGDGFQLGGVFVVDTGSIVRWAHPCTDAADIVTVTDILSGANHPTQRIHA